MPKNTNKTKSQQKRNQEEFQRNIDSSIYRHSQEHLFDELRWLNRLLAAQVLHLRQSKCYGSQEEFHNFIITDSEIDALLAAGIFEADGQVGDQDQKEQVSELLYQAQLIREDIDNRLELTLAHRIILPLMQLGMCFHLSEFELQVLITCMAPKIDFRYEKLYGYLQNDITKRYPGSDLILNLFCQNLGDRLQKLASLQSLGTLKRFLLVFIH